MSKKPKTQFGFTLIELVITMAIAAILLLVAVPGFQSFQRNSQLSSLTSSLLVAINTAKAEAMKQNASAYVIPASGADWGSGWIVFVDKDRNQSYSESGDVTVMKQEAPANYFTISGNGTSSGTDPYLTFDSSGFSRKKTVVPQKILLFPSKEMMYPPPHKMKKHEESLFRRLEEHDRASHPLIPTVRPRPQIK